MIERDMRLLAFLCLIVIAVVLPEAVVSTKGIIILARNRIDKAIEENSRRDDLEGAFLLGACALFQNHERASISRLCGFT